MSAHPTQFADLNDVLERFVGAVRETLGAGLVGIYLQGSFAVGDADEHSDVDFAVVVRDELTEAQVTALQEMHAKLYQLPTPWGQHLEGSYFTKTMVRRVDADRTPLVYLDNGATELVRDSHCNTAVVRWSLRERGIVLTGPDPKELVDPVEPDELRRDVAIATEEWAEWLASGGTEQLSRRGLAVLVLSLCRILHTLETAAVGSKRVAGEWAVDRVPEQWTGLVRWAIADREDPWAKVREPADPGAIAQALALVDYVRSESRQIVGGRRE